MSVRNDWKDFSGEAVKSGTIDLLLSFSGGLSPKVPLL
jgi:hypothetical protein